MYEKMNKLMSGVSMYYGMLFGVAGTWAAALVFSLFNILPFDPLSMIISMAVLVVSTGLSSWLIGSLFGVRAHGISSLITGFILALIFTPTAELAGLLALALVGLIAGASKYILVYKGRHIFNPVAIAAVLIGLTGLAGASWWVATPSLTLIVLAVLLISLYKSKNYAIVYTFLGVATPLLLIYFAMNGVDFAASLSLLLSWPLLFFAGVMLAEPLTLPSKKWHMYVEGVIVAVLFAIPLQVGGFETDPAVALLVGNLFAAVVAGRRAIALTFKERRALTPTTDELVFTPNTPVKFEAGQYMELTLPHDKQDLRGERRSFSVTSIPNTDDVSFGVKYYDPSSSFKKTLRGLEPGTTLSVSNVSGQFTLPADRSLKLLFIAGGIGVTPFISHIKTMHARKETRDVTLVYAVSSVQEIAYLPELEASGTTVFIVSPRAPAQLPKGWKYVKAARLSEEILADSVPDITERNVYVSGPPPFVQTMKSASLKLGSSKVKTDYFVGY